jgi:hypothetical protein
MQPAITPAVPSPASRSWTFGKLYDDLCLNLINLYSYPRTKKLQDVSRANDPWTALCIVPGRKPDVEPNDSLGYTTIRGDLTFVLTLFPPRLTMEMVLLRRHRLHNFCSPRGTSFESIYIMLMPLPFMSNTVNRQLSSSICSTFLQRNCPCRFLETTIL